MNEKIDQLPFEVFAPEGELGHSFVVTVRVGVAAKGGEPGVLQYIRSMQLKNDLMNTWVKKFAPGFGMEVRSGPRPVMEKPGDRTSRILAYEQDFRLTKPV